MKAFKHFTGLFAAPFTPFNEDGSVNLEVVEPYAKFLAKNGVSGVFVNGTTGEAFSISEEERKQLAEKWIEVAPKELTVLIHVGDTSSVVAGRLAKHAQDSGAAGIGEMGSIFFKPNTAEKLVAQCAETAENAPDLPYFYYHIPSMSGVRLRMVDFLKVVGDKIPNLAGVKFSFEDLKDFEMCGRFHNSEYNMFLGRDELFLPGLSMGATAAIGTTYNFMAPIFHKIQDAFQKGDLKGALHLQGQANDVIHVMHCCGEFLSLGKHLMKYAGLNMGSLRSPLVDLPESKLDDHLAQILSLGYDKFSSK